MINDPAFNRLRETSWQRKLTASEEVELRNWLAAHPEAQSDWEAETGLNEALGLMPEAVVSSNFTARVLQTIQFEEAAELRRGPGPRMVWWRRLAPKVALAGIIAAAGLFSYHHFHAARMRAEMAQGLVAVSRAPSVPGPEVLEDFDVIWLMAPLYADDKLLTLLQ
jgi:anti-sigma factor RsiW